MKRRLSMFLLPAALVSLTVGCTTFSDNDAAARVDDVELSYDELVALAPFVAAATGTPTDPSDADSARLAASVWIQSQIIGSMLADQSAEVDEADATNAVEGLSAIDGWADLTPELQTDLTNLVAAVANQDDLIAAAERVDIHVDPQIGNFDEGTGEVLALG